MEWLSKVDGTNVLNMVKSVSNKVKQYALNLTDIELKVEEATNNEPWGPHGSAMQGGTLLLRNLCHNSAYSADSMQGFD